MQHFQNDVANNVVIYLTARIEVAEENGYVRRYSRPKF